MTDATAMIDNQGMVTMTFTDTRTGPCNSNNEYVIRNEDTIWATVRGERGQDNIVTITFNRDRVPDQESVLTIATKNGNDESERSPAVSLQLPPGKFGSTPPRSRPVKHIQNFRTYQTSG